MPDQIPSMPTAKDNELSDEDRTALNHLKPEMAKILKNLPEEQRDIVIQAIQESFSGPIPHPRLLQGYENIQPGFAERIVVMAEKEQAHRFECDNKVIDSTVASTKRGQWMGYSIALVFGIIALVLGLMGEVAVASIIGGLDLVALVTVFVKSQSSPKERKEE